MFVFIFLTDFKRNPKLPISICHICGHTRLVGLEPTALGFGNLRSTN